MTRTTRLALAALAAAFTLGGAPSAMAQAAPGDDGPYLIRGGTVVNPDGQRIPNANILIQNNRIVSLNASGNVPNATVIDAAGKFIYPGMIDANTGIGLSEIGGA
jgi:imidazolonepropionase-like amidohydrolase